MNHLKYRIAYDSAGNICDISEATAGNKYYFELYGDKFPLVNVFEGKYQKHWRGTPHGDPPTGEGVLHKECKMFLALNKQINTPFGVITADTVLLEHASANHIKKHIPNFNLIPDCLFLDHKGKIICAVEVYVTNPKSPEQIKEYSLNQIPVIELKYENDYHYPAGVNFLYVSNSIEEAKLEEIRTLENIRGEKLLAEGIGDEINRVQEKIGRLDSARRELENTIHFTKRKIELEEERISDLTREIEELANKTRETIAMLREEKVRHKEYGEFTVSKAQDIARRIEKTKQEARRVENSFVQAVPRCKIEWYRPTGYKSDIDSIEAFFYWCT